MKSRSDFEMSDVALEKPLKMVCSPELYASWVWGGFAKLLQKAKNSLRRKIKSSQMKSVLLSIFGLTCRSYRLD